MGANFEAVCACGTSRGGEFSREAIVQQRYRGISDPDQEWILRELIHYLSSEASGAVGFEDMGEKWVPVRNAARDGSQRKDDAAARGVAERWEQFTNYLCLSLSQELGANVTISRPRTQTTPVRLDELVQSLETRGELTFTLRIPDAAGPVTIRSDLRSRQTFVSVSVDAPGEGRTKARFNWLLRQLKVGPDDLLIEASFPNGRATTAAKLGEIRADPSPLYYPPDPKREPREFVVTQSKPMGQRRGRAEGSFVRETSTQTARFYRDIVQNLKAWHAPAPSLHTETEPPADAPAPEHVITPAWASDQPLTPTPERD